MTITRAAAYAEDDTFKVEKRTVFATEWLPIAMASQIPSRGDYAANIVGGSPVFVVRGEDGLVRTFRNVCRHQQMQVVEKPTGRCTEFRCRYHGWTYDLGGRFVTAPAQVAPIDPRSPNVHLREVATRVVRDVVLFSFAPFPAEASLGEVEELVVRELGEAAPRYAGSVTSEIGCNWKTYVENALLDPAGNAAWHWPLVLATPHPAGVVVEHVVPRTYLRTRVVRHLLVPECNVESDATLLHAEAQAIKSECEALQAERVGGSFAPAHALVEVFHERLAAAYADDPES
jgi:phenylpropionate dioxygenase-like ring-hydroxylating dioxygenase large terminal subunit